MSKPPEPTPNPYAPPTARVEDASERQRQATRPPSLTWVLRLMWLEFAIDVIADLMYSSDGGIDSTVQLWLWAALVLFLSIVAAVIVYVGKGRNWARYVYAFFQLIAWLNLAFTVIDPDEQLGLVIQTLYACATLVGSIAAIMLFTQPISGWFKQSE